MNAFSCAMSEEVPGLLTITESLIMFTPDKIDGPRKI